MSSYSWWYMVPSADRKKRGRRSDVAYSFTLNRIEKERVNAERMGMVLVVEAHPLSNSYNLHMTPSLETQQVVLYGNNDGCAVTVNRDSLYRNGEYMWTNHVKRWLPPVPEDDMEGFN